MADEFYGNAGKVALSTSYVGVGHSQKSMVLLCVSSLLFFTLMWLTIFDVCYFDIFLADSFG